MVSVVLDNLAAGESADDICRDYQVTREDVRAALQYAADLANDRIMPFSAAG